MDEEQAALGCQVMVCEARTEGKRCDLSGSLTRVSGHLCESLVVLCPDHRKEITGQGLRVEVLIQA